MSKLIKKIGFEIELATTDEGEGMIRTVNQDHNLGLAFSGDGSIETCYQYPVGLEIKTDEPKKYTEIIRIASYLFPVLKQLEKDKKVRVDSSCGIHFHFDITTLSFLELWNNHISGKEFDIQVHQVP